MPSRNRDTLKYFFSDGAMPSSEMFADLIDSMLNMEEEGFRKTDRNGFEISNLGDNDALISFFKQHQPDEALWQIRFDNQNDSLVITRVEDEIVQASDPDANSKRFFLNMALKDQKIQIGVGHETPKDTLHINGNVRANGRRGVVDSQYPKPKANNEWHTIAGPFSGCQALEVVARAQNKENHRFAIMHAIAMHSVGPSKKDIFSWFGLRNRIRYTQSFYGAYLDRLKLRWKPASEQGEYLLQIRTNCDYGSEGIIDFHVTDLWSEQDAYLVDTDNSEAT